MTATTWELRGVNPFTDVDVGSIEASGIAPSVELNGPSSVDCQLNPKMYVDPNLLVPKNNVFWLYKNGLLQTEVGPLFLVDPIPDGPQLKLHFEGLSALLYARYDRQGRNFLWTDTPLDAVRSLMAYTQSQINGNMRVEVDNTTCPAFKYSPDQDTSQNPYAVVINQWDSDSIGHYLDKWSSMDLAFDWDIHGYADESGNRHRAMGLYYPRKGNRRAVTVSFDTNLLKVNEPAIDGMYQVQDVLVVGAGEGSTTVRSWAQSIIPGQMLSQVNVVEKDLVAQVLTDRRARLEMEARKVFSNVSQIRVRQTSDIPFGSLQVGDDFLLDAQNQWTSIHNYFRIMAIDYDNNGYEADWHLARSDQFLYDTGPDLSISGDSVR